MIKLRAYLQNFRNSTNGVTAVEFAFLAPIFIGFIFGVIEFARVQWTQQTLNDVAYYSARCAATNQTDCKNISLIKKHLQSRAEGQGITILNKDVTVELNVSCNGTNSHRIKASVKTNSPVKGLVPAIPETLDVESCFPVLS